MDFDETDESLLDKFARAYFGPRGRYGHPGARAVLLEAVQKRIKSLGLSVEEYSRRAPLTDAEARLVWNGARAALDERFYKYPRALETLPELLREWSVFAKEEKIKVLVLGAGRGYEALSVAMELARSEAWARGWKISVEALDFSPASVKEAREGIYSAADLRWLAPEAARRFFTPRGGDFRFKFNLAPPTRYAVGDIFDEALKASVEAFQGEIDLLWARDLTLFADDERSLALFSLIENLPRERGLVFLAPTELFAPSGKFSLEERRGVFYYRRGEERLRRARADAEKKPKKLRDLSPLSEEESALFGARSLSLQREAALALESDPQKAWELARELILQTQERDRVSLEGYDLLARAESARGRPRFAAALGEAIRLWQGEKA
ncbi:MAG: hypothetical protein LBO66_01580 [Deltaproteobacteria bacterium]|jgi:chemotaxis methyl-accepting protein methylase|nr:hypothetical protein [Deltaproteobacteria bacterium]